MTTETIKRNGFTATIVRHYNARPDWSVTICTDADELKLLKRSDGDLNDIRAPLAMERRKALRQHSSDSSFIRKEEKIKAFKANAERKIKKLIRGMTKKEYKKRIKIIKDLDKQLLPLQKEQQKRNAENLAERKEMKEKGKKAFGERRFSVVPEEMLKTWAKREFSELRGRKTQVKGSSTEWGSILIHVVDYDRNRINDSDMDPTGWYTEEAYLCGIDDNGESWIHACSEIRDIEGEEDWEPHPVFRYSPDDINDAEGILFEVKEGIGYSSEWVRQGDILFLLADPSLVEDDWGESNTYEPRTGHMVHGNLRIKKGDPDMILISGKDAKVKHGTHNGKTLHVGIWAVYPMPARFDPD